MFDGTEEWYRFWRKTELHFPKWHEVRNLANFPWLKNSDFILESKILELNQNKNSKQLDLPDALKKLYFTLEINE